MFFDTESAPVYRPPSEAHSFILRVTVGCSYNKCSYCQMYKNVQFHIKEKEEILQQIYEAKNYNPNIRRIFLSDGDALILSTDKLLEILKILYKTFPKLQRVSSYAGPKTILNKSLEELKLLKENGLKLLYYGMETGDNQTLTDIKKGVDTKEAIKAGVLVKEAGIKLSMMVILGLAGKPRSKEHAANTAKAINIIKPNMLSALTLMLYRGSELKEQYEKGEFIPLTPPEIMEELFDLINQIQLPENEHCIFRSNHISNYISIAGTLPHDKEMMLKQASFAIHKLEKLNHFDPYNNVERF